MPDYGPLYSYQYPYPITYDYYGTTDFGTLYSPELGGDIPSSVYMDASPDYYFQPPQTYDFSGTQAVPVDTSYLQDTGPADIFASLPPLFVTETQQTQPTSETSSGVAGSTDPGAGIVININNTVKNTVDVSDKIGDIIAQGIEDGANTATQIAADTAHTITTQVGNLATNIFNAVQDGAKQLWDWLSKAAQFIASNANSIIQFLGQHLADVGKAIADNIKPIMTAIAGEVDKIASTIQRINDDFIQPITNTISKTLDTVTSLTKAIETDLHDGLKGILSIPSDIASGLSSFDATMQRTVDQLGTKNKEIVDVNFKGAMDKSVGDHLDLLNKILTGTSDIKRTPTTFSDHVTLPEPDAAAIAKLTINQTWTAIKEFVAAFMHGGKDVIDDISKGLPGFGLGQLDLIQLPITLTVVVLTALAELKPILEWMEEDAAGKVGLAKLSPGDALSAWVRNFISLADLKEELKVNGWDEQRIQVMTDLQTLLIDSGSALDMFYRGIITEDDLVANMLQHGIAANDVVALIAAGRKIFGVDTALRMWRYGLLTDDEYKTVLRINRYEEEEITAMLTSSLRPINSGEYIAKHRRDVAESFHLITDQAVNQVPQAFIDAARTEGVNVDVATIAWRDSFQFPQLQQWVSLYFRGVRTHEEVMAAMEYYRIPSNLRDDYIVAMRPLLPFRTIPSMLAAGIISEGYAKQQLQAHGYDLQQAQALLDYSKAKANKVPTTVAAEVHQLSLSTALDFYRQGALTVDQYHAVLVAHGYTEEQSQLAISVEQLKEAAAHRKQVAQDIVDEALAGMITDDQAMQQLAQNNFSAAEMARYSRKLRSLRRTNSKLPSEADLFKMVKNGIISGDEYANALSAHGYAQNWVEAIINMNFPPTSLVTEGA